jgi:hypothetical protein
MEKMVSPQSFVLLFFLEFFFGFPREGVWFFGFRPSKTKKQNFEVKPSFPFQKMFFVFLFQCYFLKSGNFACFVTKSQPDERVVCNDNAWIAELNAVGNDVQTESFSDGRGSLDR